MNKETLYNSFDNAYSVMLNGIVVGRVWYQEDTDWNIYHSESDMEWDFADSFEDAVEMLLGR
jgi:hypothetical protein